MDETSQETKEINGQHLLPEIVCKIFKNLNVQDLSKVASVNKLWNQEAKREQMNRGLEKVIISVTNDSVCDSITVRPYVTLMFVKPKIIQYGLRTLQFDILQKYKDVFPDYLVTLGLHYVIIDNELIDCNLEMSEGDILSLLIPKYRDLEIKAAYTQHLFRTENTEDFLNEFLPEDSSANATFIMFGQSAFNNSEFFNSLKKSMEERQQKFNLWGAAFDNAPFAAVSGKIDESLIEESEQFADQVEYNGMFAMSITGLSLESSSIVIGCKIKKGEFEKKLADFRDQLRLKRDSIGLVCGPEEVYDWSDDADLSDVYTSFPEMMYVVKRIFPKIPCIGINDKSCLDRYYGLKSRNDDPDQQLEHEMSLTLMILTYD